MPHFGERDQRTGMFHQQDAHECWSAVVSNLALALEVQVHIIRVINNSLYINRKEGVTELLLLERIAL